MKILSMLIGIGLIIWGILLLISEVTGGFGLSAIVQYTNQMLGFQNIAIGIAICLLSFAQGKKEKKSE